VTENDDVVSADRALLDQKIPTERQWLAVAEHLQKSRGRRAEADLFGGGSASVCGTPRRVTN
jgi:hypothetical protein